AMHELSIALSILEIAEEEAERRGGLVVVAVHLKLGALSGVVKEALVSAYELACEGSPLGRPRLVVEDMPLIVACSNCQADVPAESPWQLRCSRCGAAAADVVSGRELEIVALEVEV